MNVTNHEYAVCYINTLTKHEYIFGSSIVVQAYSAQLPINNYRVERAVTHYFEKFEDMIDYIEEKKEFMKDSSTIKFIDINLENKHLPKAQ